MPPPQILHIHSTFALGGKEARAVSLMNAFGDAARHSVVSVVPDALSARDALDPGVAVAFPSDHPPLIGKPGVGRYHALVRWMRGFDLVLTYNWGAMDAVGARRLFAPIMPLPPLVHHEDGFNADERTRLKPARNAFRALALPAAHALAVPSTRLETIALSRWRQPRARLRRIVNGIDVGRYAAPPDPAAIPGLEPRTDLVTVGTLAGLRAVKNLPRLVRAVAAAGPNVRLVIVGEGPERDAIQAQSAASGIADRVILPGFLPDPARYVGLFDVFALSSDSEQAPISLIEAMAAGLPAVSTDVGDVAAMVSAANRRFVVPVDAEGAMSDAIAMLAADPDLRFTVGNANRAKAHAEFDAEAMIAAYRALYADALGDPLAFGAFTTFPRAFHARLL